MSKYEKSSQTYDAVYLSKKDYVKEAEQVHAIVQEQRKSAGNELLDVACGTGLHAEAFQRWYHVEGLDWSPGQLAVARERLPNVKLYQADMTNFATICFHSEIAESTLQ